MRPVASRPCPTTSARRPADDQGSCSPATAIASTASRGGRRRRGRLGGTDLALSTAARSTNVPTRPGHQAAADWTSVLINMNKDNVDARHAQTARAAPSVSSTPISMRRSSRTGRWCISCKIEHQGPGRLGGRRSAASTLGRAPTVRANGDPSTAGVDGPSPPHRHRPRRRHFGQREHGCRTPDRPVEPATGRLRGRRKLLISRLEPIHEKPVAGRRPSTSLAPLVAVAALLSHRRPRWAGRCGGCRCVRCCAC